MKFERIWRYREYVRERLADRGRPVEDLRVLARRLGRLLGRRLDCCFHWNPSPVLGREHVVITGDYDYYRAGGTSTIWINSHPDSRIYQWGVGENITWLKFVQNLSECAMHEHVHYLQHRARRGYEPWVIEHYDDPDKNYYADPDEIDAYAWSLVSECMDHAAGSNSLEPPEESVWWNYVQHFDLGHPVRRQLLKKTYARLRWVREHQSH